MCSLREEGPVFWRVGVRGVGDHFHDLPARELSAAAESRSRAYAHVLRQRQIHRDHAGHFACWVDVDDLSHVCILCDAQNLLRNGA